MTPFFFSPEYWIELPSNKMDQPAPTAGLKRNMEFQFEFTTLHPNRNSEQVVQNTGGNIWAVDIKMEANSIQVFKAMTLDEITRGV